MRVYFIRWFQSYGIGLEFRESNLFINESNTTEVAEGMVFNVAVSMSGLLNGKVL